MHHEALSAALKPEASVRTLFTARPLLISEAEERGDVVPLSGQRAAFVVEVSSVQ